jgi:hypothetical protein
VGGRAGRVFTASIFTTRRWEAVRAALLASTLWHANQKTLLGPASSLSPPARHGPLTAAALLILHAYLQPPLHSPSSFAGTRCPTRGAHTSIGPRDPNYLPICRQFALTGEHARFATVPCLHSLMRLHTRRAFFASAWGGDAREWIFQDELQVPPEKWLCLPVQSDLSSPHAMLSSYKSQLSFIACAASRRHSHLILPLSFSVAARIFCPLRYQCDVGAPTQGTRTVVHSQSHAITPQSMDEVCAGGGPLRDSLARSCWHAIFLGLGDGDDSLRLQRPRILGLHDQS